jgi:hypothetical protein
MHRAWAAFTIAAGFGIVRSITEQVLFAIPSGEFSPRTIAGVWNQGSIAVFNLAILFGMLALWRGFHELGLGFRIRSSDYAVMLAVLMLTAWIFHYREFLVQSRSPYVSAAFLQQFGLVILACGASVSLVQYRFAAQMNGGVLASSLKWLVCFLVMRTVLVALGTWNDATVSSRPLQITLGFCWEVVPWIFALAVSSRARLTSIVARELAQQQKLSLIHNV